MFAEEADEEIPDRCCGGLASFDRLRLNPGVKAFVRVDAPIDLGELDSIGTITAGKQADLVVIKGDPSRMIEDIENTEIVFKDGVGYDSA